MTCLTWTVLLANTTLIPTDISRSVSPFGDNLLSFGDRVVRKPSVAPNGSHRWDAVVVKWEEAVACRQDRPSLLPHTENNDGQLVQRQATFAAQ